VWALEQEPKLQGALISTDPNSGYVVAMIGGYDFEKSEFNRAFQACGSPARRSSPSSTARRFEQRGFTASTILDRADGHRRRVDRQALEAQN